jgi:hypothetical protein
MVLAKWGNPPDRLLICMSCEKPLTDDDILDQHVCDACVREAMRHKPSPYVRISLHGYGSYIQPLAELATALDGELDGAAYGTKWTLELIEMTPAEYEALPDFQATKAPAAVGEGGNDDR